MLARLKHYFASRRFKAMTKFWDDQIAEAQKRHRPVNPIRAAKQEWLHQVMRGRA